MGTPLAAATSPHLSYTNLSSSCQRAGGYAGENLSTLPVSRKECKHLSWDTPIARCSADIPKMAVARLGGGAVTPNRHPPTALGGLNQQKESFVRYPLLYLVHKISPVSVAVPLSQLILGLCSLHSLFPSVSILYPQAPQGRHLPCDFKTQWSQTLLSSLEFDYLRSQQEGLKCQL